MKEKESSYRSDWATNTLSYLVSFFQLNGIEIQARGLPVLPLKGGDGCRDIKAFSAFGKVVIPIILTIPGTNKMDTPVPQIFRNVS